MHALFSYRLSIALATEVETAVLRMLGMGQDDTANAASGVDADGAPAR